MYHIEIQFSRSFQDFDCKKRKGATEEEIRQAEEKFGESLHLAQVGMHNLLDGSGIEHISQLTQFSEALLEYHKNCTTILQTLTDALYEKTNEASMKPNKEFRPKTLEDLGIERDSVRNIKANVCALFSILSPSGLQPSRSWQSSASQHFQQQPSGRHFQLDLDLSRGFASNDPLSPEQLLVGFRKRLGSFWRDLAEAIAGDLSQQRPEAGGDGAVRLRGREPGGAVIQGGRHHLLEVTNRRELAGRNLQRQDRILPSYLRQHSRALALSTS